MSGKEWHMKTLQEQIWGRWLLIPSNTLVMKLKKWKFKDQSTAQFIVKWAAEQT